MNNWEVTLQLLKYKDIIESFHDDFLPRNILFVKSVTCKKNNKFWWVLKYIKVSWIFKNNFFNKI